MVCQFSCFFLNIRIEQSASGLHIIQYVLHMTKHCPFKYFCVYVYFTKDTFIKVITALLFCFVSPKAKTNKQTHTSQTTLRRTTELVQTFGSWPRLPEHCAPSFLRIVMQVSNSHSVFHGQKLTSCIFSSLLKKFIVTHIYNFLLQHACASEYADVG